MLFEWFVLWRQVFGQVEYIGGEVGVFGLEEL